MVGGKWESNFKVMEEGGGADRRERKKGEGGGRGGEVSSGNSVRVEYLLLLPIRLRSSPWVLTQLEFFPSCCRLPDRITRTDQKV